MKDTTEHLTRISTRCRQLLADAETRTQGERDLRAEAGWRSTIAAIEGYEDYLKGYSYPHYIALNHILAAWPEELP